MLLPSLVLPFPIAHTPYGRNARLRFSGSKMRA